MPATESEQRFLRAAQAGALDELKAMVKEAPALLDARSTTKGYTAMHYAAMAGSIPVIEWLVEQGVSIEAESSEGTVPLAVALEYRRLNAARRIQQLRDASRRRPSAVGRTGAATGAQASEPDWAPPAAASTRGQGTAHASGTPSQAPANATALGGHREVSSAAFARPTVETVESRRSEPLLSSVASASPSTPAESTSPPEVSAQRAQSADLDIANRDAAQQALRAGQRALASGDLQRAVRLLQKANALQPRDETIAAAHKEAERELQAILKEQDDQEEEQRRKRAGEDDSAAEPGDGAARHATGGSLAVRLGTVAVLALLALLSLARRLTFAAWRLSPGPRLLALGASALVSLQDRCFQLLPSDGEKQEAWAYLFYYWRAYLRVPLRIFGVLVLLLLAWFFPNSARLVLVVGSSALAIWVVPHTQWAEDVPQPAAALAIAIFWLLVWLLPNTCMFFLGLAIIRQCLAAGAALLVRGESFAPMVNSTVAIATITLLYAFCYYPSTLLSLLFLAVWVCFLMVLPKLCLALTEFCVTMYFFQFRSFFIHLILLGLLFTYESPSLMLPLALFLLLFWFFPRMVGGIVSLFFLWLLWPPMRRLWAHMMAVLDNPYGGGEAPEKLKVGDTAVDHVLAASDHYEALNSHRGATPRELKANYKRMALLLHPDKNPGEKAAAAFKRMNDAWDVVGNVLRRAEYDADTDTGARAEEGDDTGDADAFQPARSTAQEGPPGLKKRRARPGPRRR